MASLESSGKKKKYRGNLTGWGFGSLEGVVGFQFWSVYFEKMMRGRSLRLGCFGRKEEEGELFPHSSRAAYRLVCSRTQIFVGQEVNVWII